MRFRRQSTVGPLLLLLGLVLSGFALEAPGLAQGTMAGHSSATATEMAPAESFNGLLSLMESEVVSAAEAMPADKYDFAPATSIGLYTGVRSFSSQVKHLAEANYYYFGKLGVPGAVDAKTIEALKSKDQIVQSLKDSYAFAHSAINTLTPENAFLTVSGPPAWKLTRASTAAFALAHSMDHYGQLVEYLRMNGIIPPASRSRGK